MRIVFPYEINEADAGLGIYGGYGGVLSSSERVINWLRIILPLYSSGPGLKTNSDLIDSGVGSGLKNRKIIAPIGEIYPGNVAFANQYLDVIEYLCSCELVLAGDKYSFGLPLPKVMERGEYDGASIQVESQGNVVGTLLGAEQFFQKYNL